MLLTLKQSLYGLTSNDVDWNDHTYFLLTHILTAGNFTIERIINTTDMLQMDSITAQSMTSDFITMYNNDGTFSVEGVKFGTLEIFASNRVIQKNETVILPISINN